MLKFEEAVKSKLGFDLWISDENGYYGLLNKTKYGYEHILVANSYGDDSIVTIDSHSATFVLALPRAENWYQSWLGWITVTTRNETMTTYFSEAFTTWNLLQLGSLLEFDITVLVGTPLDFEHISLLEFKSQYPDAFGTWSKRSDEFGRPALILRMLERARSYRTESAAWVDESTIPEELKNAFKLILVGAVERSRNSIADYLGSEIGQDELGVLSAMALRDNPQIAFEREFDQEVENADQTLKFTVSVKATEFNMPNQNFDISFELNGAEQPPSWKLTAIAINQDRDNH